jgi:ABC-type lipopolysaccharide export system ATPase subunit
MPKTPGHALPPVDEEPVTVEPDAISSQLGWNGASKTIIVAGETGLVVVLLGAIVWTLRWLVRAFVRTFWGPIHG